jgi:3-oxoacyl-[acyl-carrier-protein] synthase II
MGAITPLGLSVRESWDRLIAGHSAITISGEYNLPVARVREFNWNSSFSAQEADAAGENKRYSSAPLSLFIQYAMASAQMALQDANIDYSSSSTVNRDRFGVSIGSGIGGIEEAVTAVRRLDRQQNLSPFFVPRLLNNMAAGNVSIRFGLRGPNHSLATACAAGAHSIGDAGRMIQQGDADIMLAGGTEACIGPLAIAGFSRAKALSTAKHPQACRPFDVDRDGFVIAEGAGVLVLEVRDIINNLYMMQNRNWNMPVKEKPPRFTLS